MRSDLNAVGDKYTTSNSWQYPSVFDPWDIEKLMMHSTNVDTCPCCGKRCADAAGVSQH